MQKSYHHCRQGGKKTSFETWYTNELGAGNRTSGTPLSGYRWMLMEFTFQERTITMKYSVSKVEKKSISDSIFEIPLLQAYNRRGTENHVRRRRDVKQPDQINNMLSVRHTIIYFLSFFPWLHIPSKPTRNGIWCKDQCPCPFASMRLIGKEGGMIANEDGKFISLPMFFWNWYHPRFSVGYISRKIRFIYWRLC